MNQWAFIAGAYALTFLGVALLSVVSWRGMRVAESQAQALTERS